MEEKLEIPGIIAAYETGTGKEWRSSGSPRVSHDVFQRIISCVDADSQLEVLIRLKECSKLLNDLSSRQISKLDTIVVSRVHLPKPPPPKPPLSTNDHRQEQAGEWRPGINGIRISPCLLPRFIRQFNVNEIKHVRIVGDIRPSQIFWRHVPNQLVSLSCSFWSLPKWLDGEPTSDKFTCRFISTNFDQSYPKDVPYYGQSRYLALNLDYLSVRKLSVFIEPGCYDTRIFVSPIYQMYNVEKIILGGALDYQAIPRLITRKTELETVIIVNEMTAKQLKIILCSWAEGIDGSNKAEYKLFIRSRDDVRLFKESFLEMVHYHRGMTQTIMSEDDSKLRMRFRLSYRNFDEQEVGHAFILMTLRKLPP